MTPLSHHRTSFLLALAAPVALVFAPQPTPLNSPPGSPLTARANPNIERAGVLSGGVLTVALEARATEWHLDGPGRAPELVETFSEPGKAPVVPGPFVRAPAGTVIRFSVRNALRRPLTFFVPASMRDGAERVTALDSITVMPGAVGTLATHATVPGNYIYRATTPDRVNLINAMAGALGGAIVVDSAGVAPPHDRVFVIMATEDARSVACDDTTSRDPLTECPARRFVYTINGTSWPRTERVHATAGDSLHWRVINASRQLHPMHMHGFFYRVDSYAGALRPDGDPGPAPGQMVVTQAMAPYSTMSITWSPDRPGNWLFHCHILLHTSPNSPPDPDDAPTGDSRTDDPGTSGMGGLMLGTIVAPRRGAATVMEHMPARELRLVAMADPAARNPSHARVVPAVVVPGVAECIRCAKRFPDLPNMHFVLEEQGKRIDTRSDASPELDLVRGQPVAITIVNHLAWPTSVHWHGVEIQDSYMDGVAGFSGEGTHLTPEIAPGDSFVARFAPPRSGTFMYHAHVDEAPEDIVGMEGALVVRDAGTSASSSPPIDDHVFFFKGQLRNPEHPLEIDGQPNPDTVVLHVGRMARFRLINLASASTPAPTFSLTARPDSVAELAADTMLVRWIPVAKDGFDVPQSRRKPRLAREIVAVGETYDFEYTPQRRGLLRLEVRGSVGSRALHTRVPIRVE